MKRFYADVFNAWTLLLTVKMIEELNAKGGDEDQTLEEEGSESQESEGADQSGDSDSESLVDPARTRVVDPART
jgi:hypothetical protein